MARARHRLDQLPAITILLLVLLATLPLIKVSSSTDTRDDVRAAQMSPAAPPALQVAQAPAITTPDAPQLPASAAAIVVPPRPVAQLIPPPDGLRSVAFTADAGETKVLLPDGATPLMTGQYTTSDHVIVVTTASVSTGGAPASLGAQRIALADGTPAWATPGLAGRTANQVALVRDGVLVTVASDLPLETLASLAADVVIRW